MNILIRFLPFTAALSLFACATVEPMPETTNLVSQEEAKVAQAQAQIPTKPTLKRKIAIGRFTNSTRYGRALLLPHERDPLADQAADIVANRLIESDRFLVFERPDVDAVAAEQSLQGDPAGFVGVDVLVIGSVTEFGRKAEGRSGFLSSTKRQTATATVEARIVDVRTGLSIFSATGMGEASVETGEIAGFGSRAAFDSSLNDRALSAAISDMMNDIVARLERRRWSTDILQLTSEKVYISGGPSQGISAGDIFTVETKGETVKSGQTGLPITLPGENVAHIRVNSFFGEDKYSEGAVATLVDGTLPPGADISDFIIVESD